MQYEQKRSGAAQVVHTHRTSYRGGWPKGFGALNSSPHSRIFTSVSVSFRPRPYLFTSATGPNRCAHRTNDGTILIRYVTLHFRDRRGETSLLHRISSATTVLLCENRSPIRYDFRCGAKGIRYCVN